MTITLILVLIFLLAFLILMNLNKETNEGFINYSKCNKYPLGKRLIEVIGKDNLFKDKNWELFLPCGYTNVEKELKGLPTINSNQKIFAVEGCDKIASKYWLWKVLENKYGASYTNYFPKTYKSDKQGIMKLVRNHRNGLKYIAKKDLQRQTGLTIINRLTDLKNIISDKKNLVIQELLNNPFLIEKRKINLRVYLLITCKNNVTKGFIHNNGFMYYTPKYFKYSSNHRDAHITTGYIDREIYKRNPLTLEDFYKYLDKRGYSSKLLKQNLKNLFSSIMNAVKIPLCKNSNLKKGLRFQIFGTDIAPDNMLNVKLIEINKGPDLGSKDKRDNMVKQKVVKDIFDLVGLVRHSEKNNFVRVM